MANAWESAPITTPAPKNAWELAPITTPAQQPQQNVTGSSFEAAATNPAVQGTPLPLQVLHQAGNFANAVYGTAGDIAKGLTNLIPGGKAVTNAVGGTLQGLMNSPLPTTGGVVGSSATAFQQPQNIPPTSMGTYQNVSQAPNQSNPVATQAIGDMLNVLPMVGEAPGIAKGLNRLPGVGLAERATGEKVGELGKNLYARDLNITKSLGKAADPLNGNPLTGKENILNTIQTNDLGSLTLGKSFDKTTDLITQKNGQYNEILDRLSQTTPPVVPKDVITLSPEDLKKDFPAGNRQDALNAMKKITGEIDNFDKPVSLSDFKDIKDELAPVYNKGSLLSTPDVVDNKVRKALTYKILDYLDDVSKDTPDAGQLRQLGRDQRDLYNVKDAYSNVLSSGMNKQSLFKMSPIEAITGAGGAVAGLALHTPAAVLPYMAYEAAKGGRLGSLLMKAGKGISSLAPEAEEGGANMADIGPKPGTGPYDLNTASPMGSFNNNPLPYGQGAFYPVNDGQELSNLFLQRLRRKIQYGASAADKYLDPESALNVGKTPKEPWNLNAGTEGAY